jgi:hypothetical protein
LATTVGESVFGETFCLIDGDIVELLDRTILGEIVGTVGSAVGHLDATIFGVIVGAAMTAIMG